MAYLKFQSLGAFVIFILVNWGVWRGEYAADDGPNSLLPYWTQYLNGLSGFEAWWSQTLLWTQGWMTGQGRFFPTANAVNRGAFIFIRSLELYKIIQALLLVALIGLIAFTVSRKLRNPNLYPLTVVVSVLLVQVRHDFDPYFAFSFLLPLTMVLLLLLYVFIEKLKWHSKIGNFFNFLLLGLISFLCFTTYEYSIILLPFLYLLSFESFKIKINDQLKSFIVVAFTACILLCYTLIILRPKRENRIPSYELSFDLVPFLKAFFAQVLAPIPFSQQIFGTLQVTTPNRPLLFIAILICLIVTVPHRNHSNLLVASNKFLLLAGIYLLLTPAILVALTQRWQLDNALRPGQSYLPVLFQIVGLNFIFFYTYSWVKYSLNSPKLPAQTSSPRILKIDMFSRVLSSFLLTVPLYLVAQGNFQQFGNGNNQSARLEIIKFAANSGLLSGVKDGSRIVSWDMNDAGPVNKAVFSIESGVDLSMFNHPQDFLDEKCMRDSSCNPVTKFRELSTFQNRLVGKNRVDVKSPTSFFQVDIIFYTQYAAIFVLSPIQVNDKVIVDRTSTRIFWINRNTEPLLGKIIGKQCIQPPTSISNKSEGLNLRKIELNVNSQFPILSAIDKGLTCPSS